MVVRWVFDESIGSGSGGGGGGGGGGERTDGGNGSGCFLDGIAMESPVSEKHVGTMKYGVAAKQWEVEDDMTVGGFNSLELVSCLVVSLFLVFFSFFS